MGLGLAAAGTGASVTSRSGSSLRWALAPRSRGILATAAPSGATSAPPAAPPAAPSVAPSAGGSTAPSAEGTASAAALSAAAGSTSMAGGASPSAAGGASPCGAASSSAGASAPLGSDIPPPNRLHDRLHDSRNHILSALQTLEAALNYLPGQDFVAAGRGNGLARTLRGARRAPRKRRSLNTVLAAQPVSVS